MGGYRNFSGIPKPVHLGVTTIHMMLAWETPHFCFSILFPTYSKDASTHNSNNMSAGPKNVEIKEP